MAFERGFAARAIFISGLKRSGTTVLWESFRKDQGLRCYDEPFHPDLWKGRRENGKQTITELAAFWDGEGADVARKTTPIPPGNELDGRVDGSQIAYLDKLMAAQRTVIDEVRVWNKIPDMFPENVPMLVIHLLRDPRNWITGHMKPNGAAPIWDLRAARGSLNFFRRRSDYNNWRYEDIIEDGLVAHHPMFSIFPISCGEIARKPAYVKLMAFWWAANVQTYRRLKDLPAGRVMTMTLAEFVADPAAVLARAYAAAGWSKPAETLYDHVRPVRPSWRADSKKWTEAEKLLGLPTTQDGLRGEDYSEAFSIMLAKQAI